MYETYWMLGEVNVPEDKKEEFGEYVLKLLDICGIRHTREIILAGKSVTVLDKPSYDENGVIRFNYCILDKCVRKESSFDKNTCLLNVPEIKHYYFDATILFIMTLQESYTDGNCYLMKGYLETARFTNIIKPELHDELIEYWDGTNLLLSEELLNSINAWKEELQSVTEISQEEVEDYLAEILIELDSTWRCRYVDSVFVKEILENKRDTMHRMALVRLVFLIELINGLKIWRINIGSCSRQRI